MTLPLYAIDKNPTPGGGGGTPMTGSGWGGDGGHGSADEGRGESGLNGYDGPGGNGGAGGAGGSIPGASGSDGEDGKSPGDNSDGNHGGGGGGGGGGATGIRLSQTIVLSSNIRGGNGGNGGNGGDSTQESGDGGSGGGGGGGGHGAVTAAEHIAVNNRIHLSGGHGGNGGNGGKGGVDYMKTEGGYGGHGGVGFLSEHQHVVFVNEKDGIISGGKGGKNEAGVQLEEPSNHGVYLTQWASSNTFVNHGTIQGGLGEHPGNGIRCEASDSTIINDGLIAKGGENSYALEMYGDAKRNTLELNSNYQFDGGVILKDDTKLRLGGSQNGVFNLKLLSDQAVDGLTSYIANFGGPMEKTGSSRWTLIETTEKNIDKGFYIKEGELYLGGDNVNVKSALSSPGFIVEAGGALSGRGELEGVLTSHGTLSPGDNTSIGVLRASSLILKNSSIYVVKVTPAGESSQVIIGGNAQLDGKIRVQPLGRFQKGKKQKYTILTSDQREGSFKGIDVSSQYKASLSYDLQNVYLLLETKLPTGNVRGVMMALNNATAQGGQLAKIGSIVNNLSGQAEVVALNALTPASTAAVSTQIASVGLTPPPACSTGLPTVSVGTVSAKLQNTAFGQQIKSLHHSVKSILSRMGAPLNFTRQGLLPNRTKGHRTLGYAPSERQLPHSLHAGHGKFFLWLDGTGQGVRVEAFKKPGIYVPGSRLTLGRTQLGGMYQVNDQLNLGLMGCYGHSYYKVDDDGGRGRSNAYELGFCGSYLFKPNWYVDGVVMGGYSRTNGHRNIIIPGFRATAHQRNHAHHIGFSTETGYGLDMPRGWTLTPFVGVGLNYSKSSNYKEVGAGNAGLDVKGAGRRYLQSRGGLQLSKLFVTENVQYYGYAKVAYTQRRSLGDAHQVKAGFVGQSATFTTVTSRQVHHLFSPSVGCTALFNNNVYATLSYQGDFGKHQRVHEGVLKLGKKL